MTLTDPITSAVSGRTLVSGDTRLTAGANGALVGTLASGDTLSDSWRVNNGKWCRTLTLPARFNGPEVSQDAALTDEPVGHCWIKRKPHNLHDRVTLISLAKLKQSLRAWPAPTSGLRKP